MAAELGPELERLWRVIVSRRAGDPQTSYTARLFSRGRAKIAHTIPIMSGKGGVGKSLVTALIAIGLRRKHYRVGILDADITGPSIPRLFGLHEPLTIQADPVKTTPQDAIENMTVVDAIYRAAGLPLRKPT